MENILAVYFTAPGTCSRPCSCSCYPRPSTAPNQAPLSLAPKASRPPPCTASTDCSDKPVMFANASPDPPILCPFIPLIAHCTASGAEEGTDFWLGRLQLHLPGRTQSPQETGKIPEPLHHPLPPPLPYAHPSPPTNVNLPRTVSRCPPEPRVTQVAGWQRVPRPAPRYRGLLRLTLGEGRQLGRDRNRGHGGGGGCYNVRQRLLVTFAAQAGGGLQPAGILPGAEAGAHQAAQEGDTETGGLGEALPLLHSQG